MGAMEIASRLHTFADLLRGKATSAETNEVVAAVLDQTARELAAAGSPVEPDTPPAEDA